MKKGIILVIFMVLLVSYIPMSYATGSDIPSSWADSYVKAVATKNLFDSSFLSGYQKEITRGEFAHLGVKLYEFYTGKTATEGNASFSDTTDSWVLKAKNLGIVGGYTDGTFKPDKNISRQELAVFFVNVFKAAGVGYTPAGTEKFADDGQIATWAKEAVYIAKANGMVSGVGNNQFNASGNATKEQSLIMFRNGQTSEQIIYKPSAEGNFLVDVTFDSKTKK